MGFHEASEAPIDCQIVMPGRQSGPEKNRSETFFLGQGIQLPGQSTKSLIIAEICTELNRQITARIALAHCQHLSLCLVPSNLVGKQLSHQHRRIGRQENGDASGREMSLRHAIANAHEINTTQGRNRLASRGFRQTIKIDTANGLTDDAPGSGIICPAYQIGQLAAATEETRRPNLPFYRVSIKLREDLLYRFRFEQHDSSLICGTAKDFSTNMNQIGRRPFCRLRSDQFVGNTPNMPQIAA